MVTLSLQCAIVGKAADTFEVKIDDAENVSTFKAAIQKKKRGKIKGDAAELKIFLAKTEDGKWLLEKSDVGKKLEGGEATTEVKKMIAENKMMPSWTIQDVLADFKMTGDLAPSSNQIHVLVVLPDQQQSGSTKKQQQYKRMSTEASCRKFLDVLADKLAELYVFDWTYRKRPSMGDVFNAVRNNCWRFRLKRGKQLTAVELPNYFTEEQWDVLKNLNQDTYRRIYDGKAPTTSEGKPYIILPHAFFTRHEIDIYKDIATKVSMVGDPTELEVKDEDEI